jgi:hypothetical protein
VEFVDDEREGVGFIGSEPVARLVEDRPLDLPQEHHVQHRVVRDEDVWRVLLHIPSRAHLCAVELCEEIPLAFVPGDRSRTPRRRMASRPAACRPARLGVMDEPVDDGGDEDDCEQARGGNRTAQQELNKLRVIPDKLRVIPGRKLWLWTASR